MLTRTFKQILADLEPIDELDSLELFQEGELVGNIPNQEGKRGSLAVYAHLVGHEDGIIDAEKALYGLMLFSEHTPDAQKTPGKHPNVDRLLRILDGDYDIEVRVKYKQAA